MTQAESRSSKLTHLTLISAAHVREAADDLTAFPERRSHSRMYGVNVGTDWFTPRDLLRAASVRAGLSVSEALLGQYEKAWRRRLDELGFPIQPRSIGSPRFLDGDETADNSLLRPLARPDRTQAKDIYAAADDWARGAAMPKYGSNSRYFVWIARRVDGYLEPFPPKAIIGLASLHSGQRPLRPKDFSFVIGGPWHSRLVELGFEVRSTKDPMPAAPYGVPCHGGAKSGCAQPRPEPCRWEDWTQSTVGVGPPPSLFEDLLAIHGGRCQVTGLAARPLLCAVPIQTMTTCACDVSSRVDAWLLLSANVAVLYRSGHLAFRCNGEVWMSEEVRKVRMRLGIKLGTRIAVSNAQRALLEQHYHQAIANCNTKIVERKSKRTDDDRPYADS
ncbi:hypothetical protein EV147_3871 [Cupriavidus agavae]|uniref:Uncharacterized protein n=1 Tax=Cupriavidus agavae TaxID=1001822 RepID=A0A4Q7RPA2_9BURK|nr:hypothetical protein EV147_3871 [Cupriavidus agavae]